MNLPKWEYTFTIQDVDMNLFMEEIDKLGSEGWELVTITPIAFDPDRKDSTDPVAYFKRQVK